MGDEFVIKLGCLRIADHIIGGLVRERIAKSDAGFPLSEFSIEVMNTVEQLSGRLVKGELKGAFLPLPLCLDLHRKGLDIRLIMFGSRGGGTFLRNHSAGIKRLEDFKGKTILTPCFLSVQSMLLHKMFSAKGMILGSDIFLEEVPVDIMPEMLESASGKDIGGVVALEPCGVDAFEKGAVKEVCGFSSLWRYYPGNAFVIKKDLTDETREKVEKIVNLFIETGEMIENGKDGTIVQMAGSFLGKNSEELKGTFDPEKLFPDYSIVATVQNYMVEKTGFLKEKTDIKDFIDKSFMEKLRGGQFNGAYIN